MGWPILVAAGASIVGGLISANVTRNNGQIAQQTANVNAAMQQRAGQQNAAMIQALGGFNAGLAMMGGKYNAQLALMEAEVNNEIIENVALYNSTMTQTVAFHNASLLEQEIDLLWEAADLDITQLEQNRARTVGTAEASFAASGVVMGQDSPADVIIDLNTQFEMDKTIIRHGADIQAKRYLDAAATSRWEGTMEANRILYEAQMGSMGNTMNAQLRAAGIMGQAGIQAAGIMGQSMIDATVTRQNAANQAYSTRYAGWAANQQAQNTAGQQILGGFLGGISNAASIYAMKKLPTSGGTTLTPSLSSPATAAPTVSRYRPAPLTQYGTSLIA